MSEQPHRQQRLYAQRVAQHERIPTPAPKPAEMVQRVVSAGGQALDAATLQTMQSHFGYDFSQVRIHHDDRAAESASAVNAKAYTVGSNVVFNAGAFDPNTHAGQELIAHELTHVVQQSAGPVSGVPMEDGLMVSEPGDGFEREADNVASRLEKHSHEMIQANQTLSSQSVKSQLPTGEASLLQKSSDGPCHCNDKTENSRQIDSDTSNQLKRIDLQRSPFWEGHNSPGPVADHTPGDDYQGPNGPVTKAAQPAEMFGSKEIGGLVSYGCYCGPGGDPLTGSRCKPGEPAIDEIDEQCRQHDKNYNKRGVDSGSVPGTKNMWFSPEGWSRSEDADQRLHDTLEAEMDANPGAYTPSAKMFGQGIKGVFGGRAALTHGAKWMNSVADETSVGANTAMNFLSNKGSEVGSGVSDFMSDALAWSSIGDAANGISSAAVDTTTWLGSTASQMSDGIGGAMDWAIGRGRQAAGGLAEAELGKHEWISETSVAAGDVALDKAGEAKDWAIDQGGRATDWVVDQGGRALDKAGEAGGWVLDQGGQAIDETSEWLSKHSPSLDSLNPLNW